MMPRWLKWIILLALAYVIYSASQLTPNSVSPIASTSVVQPITHENYPALADFMDGERWHRKLDPNYAASMNCTLDAPKEKGGLAFKATEDAAGDGAGAQCGETISLHLTIWNAQGKKTYEGDVSLALGSRQLASGLDFGLVGIKPQGVRTLVLPPYALVRNDKSPLKPELLNAVATDKLVVVSAKRTK